MIFCIQIYHKHIWVIVLEVVGGGTTIKPFLTELWPLDFAKLQYFAVSSIFFALAVHTEIQNSEVNDV
jgi:hypothetical protein